MRIVLIVQTNYHIIPPQKKEVNSLKLNADNIPNHFNTYLITSFVGSRFYKWTKPVQKRRIGANKRTKLVLKTRKQKEKDRKQKLRTETMRKIKNTTIW